MAQRVNPDTQTASRLLKLTTAITRGVSSWLLKPIAYLIWITVFILLFRVTLRFLDGSPDIIGITTTLFNAILGLLISKEIFTRNTSSEQPIDTFLGKVKPNLFLLIAGGFFITIVWTLNIDLPKLSNVYYNRGEQIYKQHELQILYPEEIKTRFKFYKWLVTKTHLDAQAYYERATKLAPSNWKAYNRLGEIYEDQQETEKAATNYRTSIRGELPAGFINLSRYYILQENQEGSPKPYLTAIGFLTRADVLIDKARQVEDTPETILNRYNYFFHRGWAELALARVEKNESTKINYLFKAKDELEQAIKLECVVENKIKECSIPINIHDPILDKYTPSNKFEENVEIISRSLANCILPEVLEEANLSQVGTGGNKEKEKHWKICSKTTSEIEEIIRSYEAEWWTKSANRID